jgi:hypothetical protein
MQNNKTIVKIIVIGDNLSNLDPMFGFHVAGIDWRREGVGLYTIIEAFEFGNIMTEMLKVEI